MRVYSNYELFSQDAASEMKENPDLFSVTHFAYEIFMEPNPLTRARAESDGKRVAVYVVLQTIAPDQSVI